MLLEKLRLQYPYIIIPSLPEKTQWKSFNIEHIESRKKELDNWLNELVKHDTIKTSTLLHAFLAQNSDDFKSFIYSYGQNNSEYDIRSDN